MKIIRYEELDDISYSSSLLSPIRKNRLHYKKIQTTAVFSVFIWYHLIGIPVPSALEEPTKAQPQLVVLEEREDSDVNLPVLAVVPESDQVVIPDQDVEFPMRLQINRIGVDAPIRKLGLAADGSMDVPKNPFDVGWYERGPRPGEIGSAVIAGHLDSPTGAPAVFADLDKLLINNKIIVENEGVSLSFRVRKIRTYPADADATDVFISTDGKAHLNLVTCIGSWDKTTNQYSDRLVVFTDKE